ncbi:putative DNA repair protein RAD57 [Seiridium unicorne]|uniref:DNA repair protein RAD57 n=1 Tax=Seiridium unicorne TaxID=138068 RepID=A0ABR2UJ26_9PEZI
MTDLSRILPDFPVERYARLLTTIEKNQLTTTDLLTLDVTDLGKRTKLPLLDLKRLCNAVLEALHVDLGVSTSAPEKASALRQTGDELAREWSCISTLDVSLDQALGGGIPTGYITEITGESGAGKTQFLLTLLLAAQLPPPHGLGRPALYISTESALSTKRLSQILNFHPLFKDMDIADKPSLDRVVSTVTPDLESQEHILQFQVPVEIARRNIGLVIIDSVTANYRAEYERGGSHSSGGFNMGARSNELVKIGQLLHELARKHNLAVVVSNQVSDRFSDSSSVALAASKRSNLAYSGPESQQSPLASRSRGHNGPLPSVEPTSSMPPEAVRSSMPEPPPEEPIAPPAMLLDHQQRWFTGWGDDAYADYALKTPSLGLVWSTQLACRIALIRRPVYGRKKVVEDEGTDSVYLKNWKRWMKVAFAAHAKPSGPGFEDAVEFEVTMGGLKAVEKKTK